MGDDRNFDEDDADSLAAVVAVGVEIADRDDKESDEGLSDLGLFIGSLRAAAAYHPRTLKAMSDMMTSR